MPRIVLFGATGYTGRLTAGELAGTAGDVPVVLAGRNQDRLARLADDVAPAGGRPQVAVADAADPGAIAALLDPGDVLVSTVGPFLQVGEPALSAAVRSQASYLDSTGEPPFLRLVFETFGPQAAERGCGLLPAFGYDFVPGNLAAGLALRDAGEAAVRVDVGYFLTGASTLDAASAGTLRSLAGAIMEPGFAWRGGRLVAERVAARVRSFDVDGRSKAAISVGGSEHLALPQVAPGLRDVNVFLGWTGPLSRPVQLAAPWLRLATRLPGSREVRTLLADRLLPGSGSGPGESSRAGSGSLAVAEAYDAAGRPLARVTVRGPNSYTLTARLLAWGAREAARTPLPPGAHGPVDGFGLDHLVDGCAGLGLQAG